jgi:hypothetical protein
MKAASLTQQLPGVVSRVSGKHRLQRGGGQQRYNLAVHQRQLQQGTGCGEKATGSDHAPAPQLLLVVRSGAVLPWAIQQ